MSIFRTRYRIVRDGYLGHEAQFRRWWMPFYVQCFFSNTHSTIEQARFCIERHKTGVLEQVQ